PTSVTVGNTVYQPAVCNGYAVTAVNPNGTGACDPRSLGINPVVKQLWKQYLPEPNDFTGNAGDAINTFGYIANDNESLKSNFFVTRLDHDFGSKNHLTATYHFYSYNPITTSQVDIGGATPGAKFGQPLSTTQRPELPSMSSVAFTSNLSANLTNCFHYS